MTAGEGVAMKKRVKTGSSLRSVFAAAVLTVAAIASGVPGFAPHIAAAQDVRPPGQERAAQPDATTGSNSAEMWRAIRRGHQGQVSLPNAGAGVMIQSGGESWRSIRNGPLAEFGLWILGGTLVMLAAFFALRGRIRVEGGFTGRLVERFNSVERFAHWVTASSFVVLGLTGLNMLYGKHVIRPVIGAQAFSDISQWGKYVHNFMGFAFMFGIVMILIIWVRDNIPNRYDCEWVKQGGGLMSKGAHPPARKFNAGQKVIFWIVVLTGASLSFSGLCLLFPFTFQPFQGTFALLNGLGFDLPATVTPIKEMQLTQLWHAVLSLVMIAVILAHIYIGTLGMEGAVSAMWSGQVDENWAKEHHSVWAQEVGIEGGHRHKSDG
jgi:formate dehydrogenase subunit gamma